MKWSIIKPILILFFTFAFWVLSGKTYANAPDIYGSVVTQTYAPIAGATVLWTDNRGAQRTTATDGNGRFVFPSWQNIGNGSGFGCGENPHTWSVSSISSCSNINESFGNTGASSEIGTIVCNTQPPPTPTPSITLTPTPTIYCVHETCFRGNQVVSTGATPTPGSASSNLLNNPTITPYPTKITFRHLLDELFMSIQLGNIRPTPTPP